MFIRHFDRPKGVEKSPEISRFRFASLEMTGWVEKSRRNRCFLGSNTKNLNMKNLLLLFSENFKADFYCNVFVETNFCFVVTDFLNSVVINEDVLTVNLDAFSLFDSVGNLNVVN